MQDQMRSLGIPLDTNPLVSKKFTYDINGELIERNDIFSGVQQYRYDSLGRVTSARRQGIGHNVLTGDPSAARDGSGAFLADESFRYDPASNLYAVDSGSNISPQDEQASTYIMRFDDTPRKSAAKDDAASGLSAALAPVQTQHYASITDPGQVWRLLRALNRYQGDTTIQYALRILP